MADCRVGTRESLMSLEYFVLPENKKTLKKNKMVGDTGAILKA
jgi:hypothetical protein